MYRKIKVNPLHHPYKKNCKDYHEFGFKDREHALNECFRNKSLNRLNSSCWGVPLSFNDRTIIKHFEHHKGFDFIINECTRVHDQPDSRLEFTITTSISNAPSDTAWLVLQQIDEYIDINIKPRLNWIDYLILVATLCSSWIDIGFRSLYTIMKYIFFRISIFFTRKKFQTNYN